MTSESAGNRKWTLGDLADHVGGYALGNSRKSVTRVATLENATADSISQYSSPAQAKHLNRTNAGIVIISEQHHAEYSGDRIVASNPRLAFAHVVNLLHPPQPPDAGIHATAVIGKHSNISSSACIGAHVVIGDYVQVKNSVTIGAGTVIEDYTVIGEGSSIGSNSTIYRRTTIGCNCRFSAGVVLGAPGFSFEWSGSEWVPIRNIGSLTIGDSVDLGACTSIDRASIGETRVHNGVKIDNNCHIGHNVEIGEHTLIVANVGIGGSTTVGKRCVIGGQVAIKDNLTLTDEVIILGTSVVTKSITVAGTYSSAVPARKATEWNRTLAKLNKLDK